MKITLIKIILFTYILVLSANTSFATTIINLSKRTPANSAFHSLIFPGWGQIYNKQATKGYVITGLFIGSLIYSYSLYNNADDLYKDYTNTGLINSSLYSDYENKFNQAKNFSYLAAGIWLYGIVDAYLTAPKPVQKAASLKKGGLFFNYTRSGCSLAYKQSF